jgi:site-specific DNA-methyltransferase (adenine-specific)
MYKYDWKWLKNRATGFANAKKQPLRISEDVLVFYSVPPKYNPQGLIYAPKTMKNSCSAGGDTLRENVLVSANKGCLRTQGKEYIQEFTNYPTQILPFAKDSVSVHPTQKPVALCEYLIRTYTHEGDTVLDNCMGSGTTGVAAQNLNRHFIGIEKDETYFNIAHDRIYGEI